MPSLSPCRVDNKRSRGGTQAKEGMEMEVFQMVLSSPRPPSWEAAVVFFLEGVVEGAVVFLFHERAGGWGQGVFFCFAVGGAVGGGRLSSSSSSDKEEEEEDDEGGGVGKTNFMCCYWSFLSLLVYVVAWLEQIEECWIGLLIYPLPFFKFIKWAMGISMEQSEKYSLSLTCCLSYSCLDFLIWIRKLDWEGIIVVIGV